VLAFRRVACPFFEPDTVWSEAFEAPWTGPRRVPLGEPYRGKCSRSAIEIEPSDQARWCNFGYARTCCANFPKSNETAPDAVRFSITSETAELISLVWIAERDHAPLSHGQSEYRQGAFYPAVPADYSALALAFVNSYRRGKSPQGIRHG
jgi:hypothetical protein